MMLRKIRLALLCLRERKLEKAVERQLDAARFWAREADKLDQLRQPLAWGKFTNNCNWATFHYRKYFEELDRVRASIKKLEWPR